MNIEEACKVVAFYNGYKDAYNPCDNEFENNINLKQYLDFNVLAKVWEKIENIGFNLRFDKDSRPLPHIYFIIANDEYGSELPKTGNSLIENLVIATALVIEELYKE